MVNPFRLAMLFVVAAGLTACTSSMQPADEAQSLVEQARWTVEMFKERNEEPDHEFLAMLKDARGVVVFPGAVKGAFIIGGEGGSGVLLAKDETGKWGYPAFYTMGGGSIGLQFGAASSEIVLVLRTPEALEAVIKHQGKLGGDIQMTFGTFGAGIQGSTTTNVGPDIVGFSHGAGLFAGVSLEGAVLARRADLNEAYYSEGATPETIVLESRYANLQADQLRLSLATN